MSKVYIVMKRVADEYSDVAAFTSKYLALDCQERAYDYLKEEGYFGHVVSTYEVELLEERWKPV